MTNRHSNQTALNYNSIMAAASASLGGKLGGLGLSQAAAMAAQQQAAFLAASKRSAQSNPNIMYEIYVNAMKAQQDARHQQQMNIMKQIYTQQMMSNNSQSTSPIAHNLSAQQSPNAQTEQPVLAQKTSLTNNLLPNVDLDSQEPEKLCKESPNSVCSTASAGESDKQCQTCNSTTYSCETCQITFTDKVMHTIHMGTHTESNPLKCNICGFLCANKYEFASHIARGEHQPREDPESLVNE